jgi:hypothetical protein
MNEDKTRSKNIVDEADDIRIGPQAKSGGEIVEPMRAEQELEIAATHDSWPALFAEELQLEQEATRVLERAARGSGDPHEVAELLLDIFGRHDDEIGHSNATTAHEIVHLAAAAQHADGIAGARLRAAGGLPDPRWILRIGSVLMMKDRAGVVGASGVGPWLFAPLAAIDGVRVHGVGHSFGTKVMLSALCANASTRLRSLLLLQGAVNHYCFADSVDRRGTPGGYRGALDQVSMPIVTTRSDADRELRACFHLAIRRSARVEDGRNAGIFDTYYALGGYGPEGVRPDTRIDIDLLLPNIPYSAVAGARVVSVNGSNGLIKNHGDVDNEATAWAHAELVGGGFSG